LQHKVLNLQKSTNPCFCYSSRKTRDLTGSVRTSFENAFAKAQTAAFGQTRPKRNETGSEECSDQLMRCVDWGFVHM
jgi:hypothetical protein